MWYEIFTNPHSFHAELPVDVSLKYSSLFRGSSPLFQRGLALSAQDKSVKKFTF